MKGWGWVVLGGLFEVGFTTALKLEQTDSRWGMAFLLCAVLSFECLAQGIKTLPVGLAYAVWTGMGSVGAVLLGIVAFGDSASVLRIVLLLGLVACLVALKLVSGHGDASATAPTSPPRPTEQ